MKLAALDLGSNSFHLLVAETRESGELSKLGSRKQTLQLGAVVRENGELSREAFSRALACVGQMAAFARKLDAEKLTAVATSALRDARNGLAFCDECKNRHGVRVELLSGAEEARLAYLGARSALPLPGARVLVADIGGGSVELAVGNGTMSDTVQSLQLGFLRLAQTFPLDEPKGPTRLAQHVQLECEEAHQQLGRFDTLILSGGTARAIAKLIDGGVASAKAGQVLKLCAELRDSSVVQLQKRGVARARASTLAAGAAVVAGVIAGFAQPQLRISPRGLREGVILSELSQHARTVAA